MRKASDAEYLEFFLSGDYDHFFNDPGGENHSHNFYIIEHTTGFEYFFGRGYVIIEYSFDILSGDAKIPIVIRFLMDGLGVTAVDDKTWNQLVCGLLTRPVIISGKVVKGWI